MKRPMFKGGQTLDLIPDRDEAHVPPGAYTIERLLPVEGRTALYRVRHAKDGHTRVLREAQLAKPDGSA